MMSAMKASGDGDLDHSGLVKLIEQMANVVLGHDK